MRTGKTVTNSSGATTNYSYVYENGMLQKMTRGSRILEFSYDANGNPVSIKYRSSATATPVYYYYGINSRGDVIGLYNANGALSSTYEYDAYGKLLSVKTSAGIEIAGETNIAILNPLRYRGYVYDNETGFYYLQTRYYDPTICRFINADGFISTGQSITGYNMFAYCDDTPVIYNDPIGCFKIKSLFNKFVKPLRVSLLMLKQAFFGNGEHQSYNSNSIVSNTLAHSQIMNNEVHNNVEKFKNDNCSSKTYEGTVSLYGKGNTYDFDLSYSVGKASYSMTITEETKEFGFWLFKTTKTRYVVNVTVSDTYNFDEYRDDKSLGSILNNWGYDRQKEGTIKPYSWDASYSTYGKWR